MSDMTSWARRSDELTNLLGLAASPIAITFANSVPDGVPQFDSAKPEPTADGRTGRVPAGCVFWMRATTRTFDTVPDDHRNCSVGMLTHGLQGLEEAARGADVGTLVETGWITTEAAANIPTVKERHDHIVYGPLAETPVEPDVVLLRINARALMILMDSFPGLRVEGKPQCHIVALAKQEGLVAVSAGCALSRSRTGMSAAEMTCAIPADKLEKALSVVRATADTDTGVARYAAADSRRFES
jgi:uncharacterized protein (DUF169 family)